MKKILTGVRDAFLVVLNRVSRQIRHYKKYKKMKKKDPFIYK